MTRSGVAARGPRTRAVTDETGWTWVEPRAALRRAAAAAVVVPGIVIAALLAAVVGQLPTLFSLTLVLLLLAAVVFAGRWLWRLASARAAVSPIGFAVQLGAAPTELAWRTVERVRASEPSAWGLVRVEIVHERQTTTVPVRLDRRVAAAWLGRAAELAPPGTDVDVPSA
ncbi:hypothetical protein ER308_12190 [Egibacter rhizosphaerae]|uniref:PH domain-containing protein n=1 Tax=Egibacter rhizosphaerae TaxID=1670831 RepID=A0A411YGA1_9ACTN|nr:hypothetical protein [Egibacter rhizosphaerae]QBI20248.1 hypothetical protein ER308_12190 [Egibacter rhizosphaerae]